MPPLRARMYLTPSSALRIIAAMALPGPLTKLARSAVGLLVFVAAAGPASAHTDRWAFSDFTFEDRKVLFTLRTTLRDVAECLRVDKNGDGDVTEDELKSAGADLLAYVNSKVELTINGKPVQATLAGVDPPRGFDPPWPILSIDKIWFVADFTFESPEPLREVTIAARLFDAIPHHLNKGKMVRGDEERAWLFNDVYRATFEDEPVAARNDP